MYVYFHLSRVLNYVTSLDREGSGLLIDVLNMYGPPLVAEILPF